MATTSGFNLEKFRRDIEKAVKVESDAALGKLSALELKTIGDAAIIEMKELVAKGISPIKGNGRFPGYKWQDEANAIKKASKGKSKAHRTHAKNKAADAIKGKYPWSVMRKYPGKTVRPVNLFLSGDFLNTLEARPTTRMGKKAVSIGFFRKKSVLKELGHREGANTQPKRPIIPQGREEFTPNLYRRIVEEVADIFRRKFKT